MYYMYVYTLFIYTAAQTRTRGTMETIRMAQFIFALYKHTQRDGQSFEQSVGQRDVVFIRVCVAVVDI